MLNILRCLKNDQQTILPVFHFLDFVHFALMSGGRKYPALPHSSSCRSEKTNSELSIGAASCMQDGLGLELTERGVLELWLDFAAIAAPFLAILSWRFHS